MLFTFISPQVVELQMEWIPILNYSKHTPHWKKGKLDTHRSHKKKCMAITHTHTHTHTHTLCLAQECRRHMSMKGRWRTEVHLLSQSLFCSQIRLTFRYLDENYRELLLWIIVLNEDNGSRKTQCCCCRQTKFCSPPLGVRLWKRKSQQRVSVNYSQ